MYFATFLALTIPLSAPALKDRPGQTPPLVGRWDCTSLVSDGQPSPQAKGLEYEFTVDGQWLIYRDGAQLAGAVDRIYHLDSKSGPAVIDLTEGTAPYVGMFKVEKDTLFLSMRTSGEGRPAEPTTTGKGLMTFTFQRVKPAK